MSTLVRDAHAIYEAAIRAVQPRGLLHDFPWENHLGRSLDSFRRIRVAGTGKASMAMAGALERALGSRLEGGFVTVPHNYAASFPEDLVRPTQISIREAGHPVPDAAGIEAAQDALKMAEEASEDDLLVVPISGGGSALWPCPWQGISLEDVQDTARLLLNSGADIHEINTVRKHLSRIKGGRLAQAAYPAHVLALLISDVVGDDVDVIASGPTVPDPSTFADALSICSKYSLQTRLPAAVLTHLENGLNDIALETPKPGAPLFDRIHTVLLGTNRVSLEAARDFARRKGYDVTIVTDTQTGEAREVAASQITFALARSTGAKSCFLWGGETTVTVKGDGKGGRNMEAALSALLELEKHRADVVYLSGGTDGIDGPTDAAGAWTTSRSAGDAASTGLDPHAYLARNDAYHFFEQINQLLRPGPTHTNVMDIQIVLVDPDSTDH